MTDQTQNICDEICSERDRQDDKWGGPGHDDQHSTADFCRWIKNYASWADQMADGKSYDKARKRLVQIAALAVAAVETIDRQTKGEDTVYSRPECTYMYCPSPNICKKDNQCSCQLSTKSRLSGGKKNA